MRHYHITQNLSWRPVINVDKLWSLVPAAEKKDLTAESDVVPVIDTLRHGYGKVLGNGKCVTYLLLSRTEPLRDLDRLPNLPFIVKARFVSALAECVESFLGLRSKTHLSSGKKSKRLVVLSSSSLKCHLFSYLIHAFSISLMSTRPSIFMRHASQPKSALVKYPSSCANLIHAWVPCRSDAYTTPPSANPANVIPIENLDLSLPLTYQDPCYFPWSAVNMRG